MTGDGSSTLSGLAGTFGMFVSPPVSGRFLSRTNRFVVVLELRGGTTTASLPNPGRLGEILLPGVELLLEPGPAGGKHPWRVTSVRTPSGEMIYLDTGRTNQVARALLDRQLIPALADYRVERAEVVLPGTRSRVDFLLTPRSDRAPGAMAVTDTTAAKGIRYLEVKSCTLFNGRFAIFPDAITERGRRHVEELAHNGSGAVLFVIHSDRAEWFVPDYHTDLAFSRTLASVRDRLPVILVGVGWGADGSLSRVRTDIAIPWDAVDLHLNDGGLYIILLSCTGGEITVGRLGTVRLHPGWYMYVGSARNGLSARLARHRRKGRKKMHWHIDYLREFCRWEEAFPIRQPFLQQGNERIPGGDFIRETDLATAVEGIAHGTVPGFGATDSPRNSHLFYFSADPRRSQPFVDLLLAWRRRSLEHAILQ